MTMVAGNENRDADEDQGGNQAAPPPSIFSGQLFLEPIKTLVDIVFALAPGGTCFFWHTLRPLTPARITSPQSPGRQWLLAEQPTISVRGRRRAFGVAQIRDAGAYGRLTLAAALMPGNKFCKSLM
jgi:hypothetical protein